MVKLDTMTGTGRAIVSTPKIAHILPTIMPRYVCGFRSPYPTVVMVTIAHQSPERGRSEVKKDRKRLVALKEMPVFGPHKSGR